MRGDRNSWAPICLFDAPAAASRTTCSSCGVSRASGSSALTGSRRGAGGAQLGLGAVLPGPGAHPREGARRGEQVLAGVGAAPVTAQPLAVQQPGARLLERAAVALVRGDRLPLQRLGIGVARGQRGAPRGHRAWPTAGRWRRPRR